MATPRESFLAEIRAWLDTERTVQSAVLFGSAARADADDAAAADGWSDFDLHIVSSAPAELERVDWARVLPGRGFALQVVRPATGGMRKATVLFAGGQIDLVLVPARAMNVARAGLALGLQHRVAPLRIALNEMATCLRSGYRFLKGEQRWGKFYARVAGEMPGVRLSDAEAVGLAQVFLSDLLWVRQKLDRGELAAAQHLLHRSLAETNFRLMRELRLRRGLALPSFGLGRRVEVLLAPKELATVQVSARLERAELSAAAGRAQAGLEALMRDLVPAWDVPPGMRTLLERAE